MSQQAADGGPLHWRTFINTPMKKNITLFSVALVTGVFNVWSLLNRLDWKHVDWVSSVADFSALVLVITIAVWSVKHDRD